MAATSSSALASYPTPAREPLRRPALRVAAASRAELDAEQAVPTADLVGGGVVPLSSVVIAAALDLDARSA